MRFRLLLLITLTILANSCEEEKESFLSEDQLGFDYFPLEIGKYWIYRTDSIIYDFALSGTSIDTTRTFVREDIHSSYIDQEGEEVFLIRRSIRRSESSPWKEVNTWTSHRADFKAYKKEDPWLFIKLVFPPKVGVKWDGNAHVDETVEIRIAEEPIRIFKGWGQYEILRALDEVTILDQTFQDVIEVLQVDESSAIERRFSVEKYAREIGLIQKEMEILDVSCKGIPQDPCPPESEPWVQKAEKGFILKQTLIEYN